MKSLLSLLTLLFFISIQTNAQSYEVDWGPTYKKEGGLFSSYRLVGIEGDYYLSLIHISEPTRPY